METTKTVRFALRRVCSKSRFGNVNAVLAKNSELLGQHL